jgi:Na+-driven multidrug efflux pump
VANIGLNLALVPLLGAKGSALATIASEALLMAGLILGFRRGKRT